MRAIAISEFGAVPEVMDIPEPVAGRGELLVRITAAGFNPFDLKVADGAMKDHVEHRFPLILGSDGAGVVDAVGPGVTEFRPGDRVYGKFMHPERGLGSYAEFGVVAVDGPVAPIPDGMILEQAAAVPTASMTGYTLVEMADLDVGATVLIVGATGGVGQAATQLADQVGAYVIATATPEEADMMRDLGAREVIDYTAGPVNEQVLAAHPDGINAIIDMVTPPNAIEPLVNLLKPGGVILSTIWALNPDALAAREVRGINVLGESSGSLLATLADLVDSGRLRVHIESQVPFSDAVGMLREAHRTPTRGKTVVKI